MTESLSRLIAHLGWADARTREALAAATPEAPREALRLYSHILGAEQVWLARLTGTRSALEVWPALTLDDWRRVGQDAHARLARFVDRLQPADLTRMVSYVNSAGLAFQSTIEDIVVHVCLHGAYHRGQIAQLLRMNGHRPAPTDFIAYVRGAPAATRLGDGGE